MHNITLSTGEQRSVRPLCGKDVRELMAMPQIDGGLIGGASLTAEKFAKVVNY